MNTRRPLIALTTTITVLAAGCGGGGGQLSDSAFTSKADAICAAANSANVKLSSETGEKALKSEEQLVASTTDKLAALKAPSDKAKAFKDYINDLKYLERVLVDLDAAAKAHDAAKLTSIEASVATFESKGKNAAKAAGITTCD
jgi:hypothetical protein